MLTIRSWRQITYIWLHVKDKQHTAAVRIEP